jgi:hypothetical protein
MVKGSHSEAGSRPLKAPQTGCVDRTRALANRNAEGFDTRDLKEAKALREE